MNLRVRTFKIIKRIKVFIIGAARENIAKGPQQRESYCCRKIKVFKKDLFIARTLPKTIKNSNFLLNFIKNLQSISQKFPFNLDYSSKPVKD